MVPTPRATRAGLALATLVLAIFAAVPSGATHVNPDWVACAAKDANNQPGFGPKCEGWRVTIVNDVTGQGTAPVSIGSVNGTAGTMSVQTSASDNAPAGFAFYRASSANGTPSTTVGIGAVEGYAHARFVQDLAVSGPGEYTVTITLSLANVVVGLPAVPNPPQAPVRLAQAAAGFQHTVTVFPCAVHDTCAQSEEEGALGSDAATLATGDATVTVSATVTVPTSATTAKVRVELALGAQSIARGPASAQARADATLTSLSCVAPAGLSCTA